MTTTAPLPPGPFATSGTGTLATNSARVAELLVDDWPMLIGGELVAAEGGRTFDVVAPYNGEVIARVPDGSPADVDRAVDAARRAGGPR